jgi:competence protein ComEA
VIRLRAIAAALLLAGALPALAAKKPLGPAERIDLNRATAAELTRLPGVGPKRAQAIVAHRSKSPFKKAEDVLAVKGLGPAWFARVKGNVTVGAAPGEPPALLPAHR